MSEHTVTLEVAEGYSKDLKANVLAIVGKGECYSSGERAVAVVALSHKADAKDRENAHNLVHRWNCHAEMLEALDRLLRREKELWAYDEAKGIGFREDLDFAASALAQARGEGGKNV